MQKPDFAETHWIPARKKVAQKITDLSKGRTALTYSQIMILKTNRQTVIPTNPHQNGTIFPIIQIDGSPAWRQSAILKKRAPKLIWGVQLKCI